MRATAPRVASILLLLGAAGPALAQCINPAGYTAHFSSVRLDLDSSVPSALHSGITGGMGAWNATSCNTNGTAFPQFVSSGAADESIYVQYVNSVNPNGQACAQINGATNGTGAIIGLYSHILINGVQYPCPTSPDLVADTIAHELGHYLGLDHVSEINCPNHIMSRPQVPPPSGGTVAWSNARQVQPDECTQANTNNYTANEYGPPPNDGGGGGGGGDEGGGGGGGGDDDGDICGGGQDAYAIDCGDNGTWDYVVCLDWWDDPYEEADHRCNMT